MIQKFRRKVFDVEAVQVTSTNVKRVAQWTKGRLIETNGRVEGVEFMGGRSGYLKKLKAYIGEDWVVLFDGTFKVYSEEQFRKSFDRIS